MMPVMLFAAGQGTRMRPLTNKLPKPLIVVAGKTLLDHALELVALPQLAPPVINLHAFPQMIKNHLAGRDVEFSDETACLLETGGGLRQALPLLGAGPVLTVNTDAVWCGPNPIPELINAWQPGMEALLLTVPKERAHGHQGTGDFTRDGFGQLTRGSDEIYTGIQIIQTDRLHDVAQATFSMNLIWNGMDADGTLFGHSYDGHWCDVGQPRSISIAEAVLRDV